MLTHSLARFCTDRTACTRVRGLTALAVGLVMIALMACSQTSAPAQQVTLRIGFLRITDDLPYFVMQEQGFAARHGLRLVEILYQSGAATIEALAAGEVDLSSDVGTVPILAAAERGLIPAAGIPIGANYFVDPAHPSLAVLAAPSVHSWPDFAGQSIAVNGLNSLSAAAIQGRLRREGVRGTTLVEIPFANMGLAVAGGNVLAAVMSEPWLTQSLLRGDGTLLDWVIGGSPFEHLEGTMIITRAALYHDNPQAVQAFLRAHLQAVAWITRYPDRARAVLAKWLELNQEVAQQVRLPRWSPDARNDPALLESMQPLLVELGLLKAVIPVHRLYNETLLTAVLAEKR